MAFNSSPSSFFGVGYSLASSAISLITATNTTGVTVGTTFVGSAATDTITTAAAHGLKTGNRVRVVAGTGALPTGISAATDYWVRNTPTTTTLTLSATRGGALIDLTADGGTAHLLKSMGPLDEVTDTEANATTGDWRKIVFGIMEMIYQRWASTQPADRPSKLTITRTSSINSFTGNVTYNYGVKVSVASGSVEVDDE